MIWNGKELDTIGKLAAAVVSIAEANDQAAADRFMREYRAENEHADANVGYLSGYYSADTMEKIQRMFHVAHPVLSRKV